MHLSSVGQSHPYPLAPTGHPQDPGNASLFVPEGRTSRDGLHLDSLAQDVNTPLGVSTLTDALLTLVQQSGQGLLEQWGAYAIGELDTRDLLPQVDASVLAWVTNTLLELGQDKLLLRLAQLQPGDYVLRVGAIEAKALVLEKFAHAWPPHASVALLLSPGLDAAVLRKLQTFVQCPLQLSVHVHGERLVDSETASAWKSLLQLRPLNNLSIDGNPFPPELLKALPGLEANCISLSILQPAPASTSTSTSTSTSASASASFFEEVLLQLVQASGAKTLNLSNSAMDGRICAELVKCRQQWEQLTVRLSPEVTELLSLGQHKIAHLSLQPVATMFHATPAFMKLLQVCHVGQLSVNAAVDIGQWMVVMEHHASSSGSPLPLGILAACCLVKNGDDMVEALSAFERISTLVVVPWAMPLVVEGYEPMKADVALRLLTISHAKAQAQAVQRLAAQWVVQPLSDASITRITGFLVPLLDANLNVEEVRQRLASSQSPWKLDMAPIAPLPSLPNALGHKLGLLERAGVPVDMVRTAIAIKLSGEPTITVHDACMAFIEAQVFRRERKPHEWRAMGMGHLKTWMASDNSNDWMLQPPDPAHVPLAGLGPTAPSRTVDRPTMELLKPRGLAGVFELEQYFATKGRSYQENGRYDEGAALLRIASWIHNGFAKFSFDVFDTRSLARVMLDEGEHRLLGHIMPTRDAWTLPVLTSAAATTLAAVGAPKDDCEVVLELAPSLAGSDLRQVGVYAKRVNPSMLMLRTVVTPEAASEFWDALAALIASLPGLRWEMIQSDQEDLPAQELVGLLRKVQTTPMRGLSLHGLPQVDEPLLQAFRDTVTGSGMRELSVTNCDEEVALRLLPGHSWQLIHVTATHALAERVETEGLRANALTLAVSSDDPDGGRNAESIIGNCKGLETLVVDGPINILNLARALYTSGSVYSVRCERWGGSPQDQREAAKWFDRNAVIARFHAQASGVYRNGGLYRSTSLGRDIDRVILRNMFRDSNAFRVGAGRGWGRSMAAAMQGLLGVEALSDAGGFVGNRLDRVSALALSATSKAAYAESRQPWQGQIDQLALLLKPDATYVDLCNHLNTLHANKVLGERPEEVALHPSNPVLSKVVAMRLAGMHDTVIALVLARTLFLLLNTPRDQRTNDHDAAIPQLLEALAYVGRVPPEKWLKEGVGIHW